MPAKNKHNSIRQKRIVFPPDGQLPIWPERPTLTEEVRDLKVLVGELIKRVGFLRCEVKELRELLRHNPEHADN